MGIGLTEYLLIAVVLLLLFGPKKLPELGRALGRTLKEFKKGARDIVSDEDEDVKAKQPLSTASVESPAQPTVQTAAAQASPSPEKQEVDNRRLPE